MALTPIGEQHALQIQAGTIGRKTGHAFEDEITLRINSLEKPYTVTTEIGDNSHVIKGRPELLLLDYVCTRLGLTTITNVAALSTGALATSEDGKKWLEVNGVKVSKCKSDLILTITTAAGDLITAGISTKQCSNKTPTNAQLFFTTARSFSTLLRNNGIAVSNEAENALRQFCGDEGFRPLDTPELVAGRQTDPRRFFWEEITNAGKQEWEGIFAEGQDAVTRLLLQKAYLDDPFAPDFLLHKTKLAESWETTELALYSIDELVELSRNYAGFVLKPYSVRKGSYRDPAGVSHDAPRFGVVQMQRGGQAQHPTQLQFNLEAGYFYKI